MNPKVEEVPTIIQQIYEKEKFVSLKVRNIKLSESELDDSLSMMRDKSQNLTGSRLLIKELIDNQQYLEKRREDLEMMKKYLNFKY